MCYVYENLLLIKAGVSRIIKKNVSELHETGSVC